MIASACALVTALSGACRREASTAEPGDHHAAKADESSTAEDPADRASEHPMVDIDLSPTGIAATIRGPDGAKAKAADGYITVDAEPDFHMEVHRGPLDVLEEKADVVRRWGPAFRRFVQDDGTTVIYETEGAGEERYHFFSAGKIEDMLYHCRSDKKGALSIGAVQLMIVGCHAVSAHDRVADKPIADKPVADK